jgi:hypothetical protein
MEHGLGADIDLLANARRRQVVGKLLGAAAGDGLAVAELPTDRGDRAVDGGRPSDATQLRHVHLPKLDAADVVDWDRRAGVVRRGSRFDDVEPLYDAIRAVAAERGDDRP